MEDLLVPYTSFVRGDSDIAVIHDDNTIVVHKGNRHSYNYDANNDFFKFPPGFRFCPLDEELIRCYLRKKVLNQPLPPNKIHEVNLYKFTPLELSVMFATVGEKEWYFFTPRDRKYKNGQRPNRAAGTGFWKATGADKPIRNKQRVLVGYRKALVFYEGKPPKGVKTNWIMHEYRVEGAPSPKPRGDANDMRLDDWVLCRIYKKAAGKSSEKKPAPQNQLVLEPVADQAVVPPPPPPPQIEQGMIFHDEAAAAVAAAAAQFSFLSEQDEMQPFYYYPYPMEYEYAIANEPAIPDLEGLFITKNDDDDSIQEYMDRNE